MQLAAVETFLSRPAAPTRRISLGESDLPTDPAPGFGGILLAGLVGRFGAGLDSDTVEELDVLLAQMEAGRRVAQPRLRHRLQVDNVGLQRCVHRLVDVGDGVEFHFEGHKGTPLQHTLCAIYAAERTEAATVAVLPLIRTALTWVGGTDADLLAHLSTSSGSGGFAAAADPIGWAIELLQIQVQRPEVPTRRQVQQAFRLQLRHAHPDHGADDHGAADRIRQLSEARRILLG